MERFDPKYAEETIFLTFDFSNLLAAGETISLGAWDVSVVQGTDPDPGSMKDGDPQITANKITQKIIAGVEDTLYRMKATATTDLGQVLVLVASMHVLEIP